VLPDVEEGEASPRSVGVAQQELEQGPLGVQDRRPLSWFVGLGACGDDPEGAFEMSCAPPGLGDVALQHIDVMVGV
jgi:hypothetical protein